MRLRPSCSLVLLSLLLSVRAFAEAKQCVTFSNQGLVNQEQRHLIQAREAYLACVAETDCPSVVRDECQAALAELEPNIPTLLVSVVDSSGRAVTGSEVMLDGYPTPLESATAVDPGPHTLIARFGALTLRRTVNVSENVQGQRIQLAFDTPLAIRSKPSASLSLPPAPSPALARPEPVVATHSINWPVIALAGAGSLAATSFAYFGLSGHADTRELERCKPHCPAADVKAVQSKYLAADISLAVAVVSVGSAGYLLFSGAPKAAKASNTGFDIALAPIPGGTLVAARWLTE